jgi:hypothetical protein
MIVGLLCGVFPLSSSRGGADRIFLAGWLAGWLALADLWTDNQ